MMVQALVVASVALAPQGRAPQFTDAERQKVVAYWSEPGRSTVGPPLAPENGPYAVRLTPEASKWFWSYNRARGLGKTPPSQTPGAQNEEQRAWEEWIDAKVARDRWVAGKEAEKRNLADTGTTPTLADTVEPPDPGPIPGKLRSLAGEPPRFAACVQPKLHTIAFPDMALSYVDYVPMRVRYAYFRFPQGVMSAGLSVRQMPQEELDSLFKEAGLSASEQRVMKAVSMLEGGFDSINTYDTGFVSAGLIQFACLQAGAGSLGAMLLHAKVASAESFDKEFRAYGIDVDPQGALVALDPATGEEHVGPAAAQKIIDEPRLAAVFQHAGRVSRPFQIAQIQAAKTLFYPAADVVTFQMGQSTVAVKVAEIVHSEAAMATLMDRKVNTGKLDPLAAVLAKIAADNKLTKVAQLADFEWDIATAMKYRRNYLADQILAQPDRHGKVRGSPSRSGRRKKR